jgi:uncharacterized protein YqeY
LSTESNIKARLQHDLSDARKARDKERTVLFSTTLAEVRNVEIDKGRALTDDELQAVVARAVKQRDDAAEQMRAGGRPELAAKEEREAKVLKEYLPPPLSEVDVRAMVRDVIADGAEAMGAVMGRIMPQLKGRFDGKEANRIVREELGL